MRGELALRAKIIGCSDQSLTEMVLPDSIDDHSGGEVTCAVLMICEPFAEGAAAMTRTGVFDGIDGFLPVIGIFAHQYGQEPLGSDCLLELDVTPFENVRLLVEMRITAAISVVFEWFHSFRTSKNFGGFLLAIQGDFSCRADCSQDYILLKKELEI